MPKCPLNFGYFEQRIAALMRNLEIPLLKISLIDSVTHIFLTLIRHIRRAIEEKALEEKYSDFKTYVMNRFSCDSTAADKFVKSWPRVRSPGLPRLDKILDFFLIGI